MDLRTELASLKALPAEARIERLDGLRRRYREAPADFTPDILAELKALARPDPPDLAAALKDATNNAKIMVTSGLFQEDLVFTRPVTIEGDKTVLQGTLRADARVRIENCTIRGQLIPLSNFELVRCNLEIQP